MDSLGEEAPQRWKSLSFTHVEYIKGDWLGFILAWSSLIPFMLVIGFITHIYFRRELHTMFFFIGICISEVLNRGVKYVVREPRPDGGHSEQGVKYGWPSSHSQFIFFFVSYKILFVYIRLHGNMSVSDIIWKHVVSVLGIACAVTVAYSRVYLVYHTASQVIWGSLFGTVLGMLWFLLVHLIFTPVFPQIVSLEVCELFLIRDSTNVPNILRFEYATTRKEASTRLRKNSNFKLR